MKKIALAAIVTVFGYVSAQAQVAKTAAGDDNKDGKHTYGVVPASTGQDKPGVKHIANRSKAGGAKTKGAMVKQGTAVKAVGSDGKVKDTPAVKPRPEANKGKGKRHGNHKQHRDNGKHLGQYKHTNVPVTSKGCNK
jgi:hypothetical protein